MLKKLAIGLSVIAVLFGVNATINTNNVQAVAVNYDHFCHRSDSVTNPYQNKPFSTGYSEIDGEGNSDHTLHTGPVVITEAQAQQLKDAKLDWGDIIPPVPGVLPNGYNWTTNGQKVYFAGCAYPELDNEEPLPADIHYTVACNQANKIVVTVVNLGEDTGYITVNGEEIEVEGGKTVTREFADGTHITVRLDGEESYDYDKQVTCQTGGSGGGSTTTTTPPAEVTAARLPDTAGLNYVLLFSAIAAATVAVSLGGKRLLSRFL